MRSVRVLYILCNQIVLYVSWATCLDHRQISRPEASSDAAAAANAGSPVVWAPLKHIFEVGVRLVSIEPRRVGTRLMTPADAG